MNPGVPWWQNVPNSPLPLEWVTDTQPLVPYNAMTEEHQPHSHTCHQLTALHVNGGFYLEMSGFVLTMCTWMVVKTPHRDEWQGHSNATHSSRSLVTTS